MWSVGGAAAHRASMAYIYGAASVVYAFIFQLFASNKPKHEEVGTAINYTGIKTDAVPAAAAAAKSKSKVEWGVFKVTDIVLAVATMQFSYLLQENKR